MAKTVVLTGASRGLGLELCKGFLRQGDKVYALVRSRPQALLDLAGRYPALLELVACDVGDSQSVERAAETVKSRGTGVDIPVNNAGAHFHRGSQADFRETDFDGLTATYEVNAAGPMRVCKAFYPLLGKGALVAAISSSAGSMARCGAAENQYAYRMSKAALNMAMRLFSNTAARDGIRTLLLDPGWMNTDMGGGGAPYTVEENGAKLLRLLKHPEQLPEGELFLDHEGLPVPW